MQVDYEASPQEEEKKDLEVGGYEDDSDDELEKKEIEESKAEYEITLTDDGKQLTELADATLLVLSGSHAQTMAKIMYSGDWTEVGDGIKRSLDKDKPDKKPKTLLKLYALPAQSVYFALPDSDKMGGSAINPTVAQVFGTLKNISRVVVLHSLFKNKYPNPDELVGLPDGKLAMKTYKTSFVPEGDAAWLLSDIGTPAFFMAPTGGFGAACLVECEMTGRPGFQVSLITDGHYVSTESMSAYAPVMVRLGLASGAADFDAIAQKPGFKDILREANQTGTSMFC